VNLLYSLVLKEVVIIDVMIIALGFVLRAWAGAVVIDVTFDTGLSLCTFLLALFLGFGKRRHELVLLGENEATSHRVSLRHYSPYFLDQLIGVVTASVVVVYILYVISPSVEQKLGTDLLWTTTPFVLYGVFRYLYLVHICEEGGSPTSLLLTDMPLLVNVLLWIVAVGILLY
ncbi:MAG: decaprenyl-phosphate phosphoribosyltransferase, partial [Candidatus Zixiibacteriota bacterium]